MLARDFCYWLQGLFELAPLLNRLDAEQVGVIKKHLELVFKAQVDLRRYPDATVGVEFCQYLDGVLAASNGEKEGFSPELVKKVKEKLNKVFLHTIDTTFLNREQLSKLHNEGKPPSKAESEPESEAESENPRIPDEGGIEMMC